MKHLVKYLALVAFLLALLAPPARAADQYGYVTVTNNTGTAVAWATGGATNWAAPITLVKHEEFVLEISQGTASAAAGGTIDVRWSTSSDGTTWTTGLNQSGNSGWFSAGVTNSAAGMARWRTNITVGSIGYWRIDWATNQIGQTITNFNVRAYLKPKRNG